MPPASDSFTIRPYEALHEAGWVRCRALAFLSTQYYDDVKPSRTVLTEHAIALVALSVKGEVIGVIDIEIDGNAATIDTIATHPDHQGIGVANALLEESLRMLKMASVSTLDAWTREDAPANKWYLSNGFSEQYRYLHVYMTAEDNVAELASPVGLSSPVSAFFHASIEDESRLRSEFKRVHVCRQYVRHVTLA